MFTNCLPCTGSCTRHGRGQEVPEENQKAQTGSQQSYYVWFAQKWTKYFANILNFFYFLVNLYLENLTKITVLTYPALNFPKVNINNHSTITEPGN